MAKIVTKTEQPTINSTPTQVPPSTYQQSQLMNPKPHVAEKERAEIRSLGIWSMAKFNAVVLTIVGFVLVGVYTVIAMIVNPLIPSLASNMVQSAESTVVGTTGGVASLSGAAPTINFAIPQLSPLIILGAIAAMALWGLISGAILAICYNVISKVIGGIEITLQEKAN